MKPPRRQSGFTLIELLVVLAVAGLIFVMLGGATDLGARSLARSESLGRDGRALFRIAGALRQIIAHIDPGTRERPLPVRGDAGGLAFTGTLPDPRQSGTRLEVDAVLLADERGRLLVRWVPHGRDRTSASTPNEMVLATDLARVSFAYIGANPAAGWQAGWSGPGAPDLVRIEITPGTRAWPPIVAAPALAVGPD